MFLARRDEKMYAKRHIFLFVIVGLILAGCRPASPVAPVDNAQIKATATSQPTPEVEILPTNAPAPSATVLVEPTATQAPLVTPTAVALQRGQLAIGHLNYLSGELGARPSGSKQERTAAEYIKKEFERMGYAPRVEEFTFEDMDGVEYYSQNVIVVKPGLSEKLLVVGAHYDSGPEAMGADDNASGVGVMLEAAEVLANQETPYTIVFAAFGAEENDLDGSYDYVYRMTNNQLKNIVAMINLDSLAAGDKAYMYGNMGEGSLHAFVMQSAKQMGYELTGFAEDQMDSEDGSPCACADIDPFARASVPFIYFEATNWDLGDEDGMTQVDPQFGEDGHIRHSPFDTIEYINTNFPGRIEKNLDEFTNLLLVALTDYQAQ